MEISRKNKDGILFEENPEKPEKAQIIIHTLV